MDEPTIPQKEPHLIEVEAGKIYAWCSCALSKNQPFCDGSHSDTDSKPVIWEAKEDELQAFCGCKRTKTPPFCDGTHNSL
jgi:CDGSH iron-sulfur domain-containing protein 3